MYVHADLFIHADSEKLNSAFAAKLRYTSLHWVTDIKFLFSIFNPFSRSIYHTMQRTESMRRRSSDLSFVHKSFPLTDFITCLWKTSIVFGSKKYIYICQKLFNLLMFIKDIKYLVHFQEMLSNYTGRFIVFIVRWSSIAIRDSFFFFFLKHQKTKYQIFLSSPLFYSSQKLNVSNELICV